MAVTIPTSDVDSTNLNSRITTLTTNITNAGANYPLVAKLTQDKRNAQHALVLHLLGSGHMSAASCLQNETYISGTSDGV